jgi:hypothetical protein
MKRNTTLASSRTRALSGALAAVVAIGASLGAVSAFAQDQIERAPTTGSHIDPKARPTVLETIVVPGGATEAGRAVPLDASEKTAAERPAIAEVDASQWLPDEAKPRN